MYMAHRAKGFTSYPTLWKDSIAEGKRGKVNAEPTSAASHETIIVHTRAALLTQLASSAKENSN